MWWVELLNSIVALLESGAGGGGGAYESIASFNIASTTASVTFSSIPSTYVGLQLRITGRHSGASTSILGLALRFNGDSSANYIEHFVRGNGSTVIATGNTGRTYSLIDTFIPGNNFTSGIFGAGIVDIHNYASTTQNKTLRSIQGIDANGSGNMMLNSSLWVNTSAISTILAYPESNSWVAGTTISLYGIKGA
jgi:hypothetical protein